ncbi:MAG TPA: Ig-like domain repeat protein [Edaphobacter sp.]|nr:Ig-like domain repeat protein [Edaphobacter sp.]
MMAQLPVPRSRVVHAVDEARLKVLAGNTHPLARPEFDRGALDEATPMHRIVLVLQRGPEQEKALERLLDQQQDKTSPSYHQWLTPEAFGAAFGPTDSDLSAVTGWLSDHGFAGIHVNAARTLIEFNGTAGAVRRAFHTTMHRYEVEGEQHIANASDPEVPEALAPVIAGIASLNNFPRKAESRKVGNFRRDAESHAITRLPEVSGHAQPGTQSQPDFTITNGGHTFYGVTPYDFASLYNVLPLWNAGIDGTGQTIAIPGQTEINAADFVNFRKLFNLPLGNTATPTGTQYLNIIYNGPSPGIAPDEGEADIDTQWSGAVAKGATIDYVISEGTEVTQGTDLSAIYIVDNDLAPILSYSYGQCELFLGTSGNAFYSTLWQQAAAEGITVVVASGDSGAAGCDASGPEYATNGLGVNGLSSTPNNIAVGGTDFYMPNGGAAYWSTANDPTTEASVLGHIPETPWNETCTNSAFATLSVFLGESPEQVCNSTLAKSDGFVSVVGGGGGVSDCTRSDGRTASSCSGGYPKPAWQAGKSVPQDGLRDVPDVSLFASSGFFGAFYVVCQQSGNVDGKPCSLNAPSYDFAGYGGTSVATPAFAGIIALINQKTGNRQGNANYALYNLANQQTQAATQCGGSSGVPASDCMFNDVTISTIAMPCLKGSPNCTTSNSVDGIGVLSGWKGANNYDLATGLGSVNAANLVNNWSSVSFTATATSLTLSPAIVAHGSPISASVAVTSTGGTPAGGVSINGLAANGSVSSGVLSGGAYTTTIANFPGGTYSVSAHYAGNGTYAASDSNAVSLTVTPEASTTRLRALLYNFATGGTTSVSTQPYGSLLLLRTDISGISGQGIATGIVSLTDNGAPLDGGTFRLNSNGYTEDQTTLLAPGTHVLAAAYSGDSSFNASQSSAVTLTITKAQTATSVPAVPSSVFAGGTFQLNVKVTALGGKLGAAPTGSITVNAGNTVLSTAPLSGQSTGTIILVPASQLAAGANLMTVTYSGDANYAGSVTAPFNINVTGTGGALSSTVLTLSQTTVLPGAMIQLTGQVTSGTAPTPTGVLTFMVDGRGFGAPEIMAGGKTTEGVPVSTLALGTHSLTAVYSGDSVHAASVSAPVILTISNGAIASATTISLSTSTVEQGTALTVTSSTTSSTSLTGSVQLLLDGDPYGQPVALVSGTASFSLATGTIQPGPHAVQARYLGDATHLASTSGMAALTVLAPSGSFTLSASSSSATAISGGASGGITLTVTPSGGFHSTVVFACSGGLPAGDVCQFSPSTLTPSSPNPVTDTMVIAPASSPKQQQASGHRGSGLFPVGAGLSLAGVFLFFLPNRRRLSGLMLVLVFAALGTMAGCGSGGSAPASVPGVPTGTSSGGTYNVMITATGGTTIQTASITLTVH